MKKVKEKRQAGKCEAGGGWAESADWAHRAHHADRADRAEHDRGGIPALLARGKAATIVTAAAGQAQTGQPRPVRLRPSGSDRHLEIGDLTGGSGYRLLGPDVAGRQDPQHPRPWRREEPEAAVGAQRNLGDEFSAGVEQPGVSGGEGQPVMRHMTLHHRLRARIRYRGHRNPACRCTAPVTGWVTHEASPVVIGTPTSDPYSVQEPS